jgi:hypothetical protein
MNAHIQMSPTQLAREVLVTDLAGASITPEFIASLPPIQANPKAERKFALGLSARVFGHSVVAPSPRARLKKAASPAVRDVTVDIRPVVAPDASIELERRRYKTLTADLNYSPELARLISRDKDMWRAVIEFRRAV